MDESQQWWKSKTVWTGIAGAVGAVGDMVMNGANGSNVTELALALFGIYSRIDATHTIRVPASLSKLFRSSK